MGKMRSASLSMSSDRSRASKGWGSNADPLKQRRHRLGDGMSDERMRASRTHTYRGPEFVCQQALDGRRTTDIASADRQDGECVLGSWQQD